MVGGDTKSTSSTDLSQPTTSEGDVAGENMGTSDGATYLKPSLEEGIADAAPVVVPVAAPSATPNVDGMPL